MVDHNHKADYFVKGRGSAYKCVIYIYVCVSYDCLRCWEPLLGQGHENFKKSSKIMFFDISANKYGTT